MSPSAPLRILPKDVADRIVRVAKESHAKEPGANYVYGTAGFRMKWVSPVSIRALRLVLENVGFNGLDAGRGQFHSLGGTCSGLTPLCAGLDASPPQSHPAGSGHVPHGSFGCSPVSEIGRQGHRFHGHCLTQSVRGQAGALSKPCRAF